MTATELRATAKAMARSMEEWLAVPDQQSWDDRAAIRSWLGTLRAALGDAGPDHRVCACGHPGSVHEVAHNAPVTDLGYAVEGVGQCHGSTDGGNRCPCIQFTKRRRATR